MVAEVMPVQQAHFEPGTGALSPAENRHLKSLESRINKGLNTFREVGEALLEIRDKRLYRTEHATFESYCRERWSLDRARAYQLMGAAEVASVIPDVANEVQARELLPMVHSDPEMAKRVWKDVTASDEPVTAPRIREAVRAVTGVIASNGNGHPVTPTSQLIALINRTTTEYEKWKTGKPDIGQRTLVKQAFDRLAAIAVPKGGRR